MRDSVRIFGKFMLSLLVMQRSVDGHRQVLADTPDLGHLVNAGLAQRLNTTEVADQIPASFRTNPLNAFQG
jgi:hypothetical protein